MRSRRARRNGAPPSSGRAGNPPLSCRRCRTSGRRRRRRWRAPARGGSQGRDRHPHQCQCRSQLPRRGCAPAARWAARRLPVRRRSRPRCWRPPPPGRKPPPARRPRSPPCAAPSMPLPPRWPASPPRRARCAGRRHPGGAGGTPRLAAHRSAARRAVFRRCHGHGGARSGAGQAESARRRGAGAWPSARGICRGAGRCPRRRSRQHGGRADRRAARAEGGA